MTITDRGLALYYSNMDQISLAKWEKFWSRSTRDTAPAHLAAIRSALETN